MPAARPCCKILVVVSIALGMIATDSVWAQPPGMMIQGGRPSFRGGPPPGMVMPAGAQPVMPGQPAADQPKPDEKKEEDKKDGDKKDEEKKDGPVTRPNAPPKPADPRELEAKPDANGRITFSFNGQPWADVLQWLANVSELSLDWRELPSDYLNLTTQRSYTLPEARDLINRHLQARGYALLLSGEVMSVVKLDAVDPSLVPRATEEDLYDLLPHDLVKLSLELPEGMDAKQAVEDVKQAMSPHAKVMPLAATKRLLLIDTVANLRMVSALLNSERLAVEGRAVPREFVLKYIQASAVIDTLYVVLGLDPNSRPSQMELQMQQQKMQLMQQMAQSGKDVMPLLQKDGPPVYLAYNRQRNSVLANAPEPEMRVIERTIKALDIPAGGVADSGEDDGPMVRTLEQYRLKTITPDAVITTLEEIGNLSPRSELRGDKDSKTIFARASATDHEKIKELISQLDGSETMVEVFWLRRLPAEAVAGSIQSWIIEKPKKKESNNDYPFYMFGGRRNQEPEEPDTILRVDADIENNRLIVRGTPQQLDEVRDLLVKLGEPIGENGDTRRVRMFDAMDPDETQRLLEQIKEAWPAVGGDTELVIPPTPKVDAPADKEPAEKEDDEEENEEPTPATVAAAPAHASPFRLLATTTEADPEATEPEANEAAESKPSPKKSPPVTVQIDQRGRIVIASDDTAALDRLQELVADLAPEPAKYEVFEVKNRTPEDIVFNLETYFKDFLAEDDEEPILDWWGRMRGGGQDKEPEPVRLSRRQPLRFLADDWSSSILVANATAAQLEEMEKLIKAWDRQPVNDRILTRRTATVKLRYAKASVVVSALKDVYRDLLSKGDREFDTEESKASGTSLRYLTRIQHQEGEATEPTGIPFGGVLSLGSDDAANVVIVSARSEVYDSVLETIDDLDQQARPTTTVKVVQLEGGMASDALRQALARALTAQGAAPPEAGNNDRDRRGGDRRDRGRDRWRGRGRD